LKAGKAFDQLPRQHVNSRLQAEACFQLGSGIVLQVSGGPSFLSGRRFLVDGSSETGSRSVSGFALDCPKHIRFAWSWKGGLTGINTHQLYES
jgi:hypothetical protein